MDKFDIIYRNNDFIIKIPKKSFDEYGNYPIENIEKLLQRKGISENNEINPYNRGRLWLKPDLFPDYWTVHLWDEGVTEALKRDCEAILPCLGSPADFVDSSNPAHVEWTLSFCGNPKTYAFTELFEMSGYVITDIDKCQAYKVIKENEVYLFREDRCVENTNNQIMFTETMYLLDYSREEILSMCAKFGHPEDKVERWLREKENIPFILQLLFGELRSKRPNIFRNN